MKTTDEALRAALKAMHTLLLDDSMPATLEECQSMFDRHTTMIAKVVSKIGDTKTLIGAEYFGAPLRQTRAPITRRKKR